MLDGSSSISIIKSICEEIDVDAALENVIIVGVSSGLDEVAMGVNRTNDYTTSKDAI